MINPDHQAWPDLAGENETVRLVDQRLTEALSVVAMTGTELMSSRELDVIQAVGQHNTQAKAGAHLDGLSTTVIRANLRVAGVRLPQDNKYVRLFNASNPSLVYVAGHEGLVSYGSDEGWDGSLTRDQAIALKIIALGTEEKDLLALVPRGRYPWWSKSIHTEINTELDIPGAGYGRTVGRAFQVGLFIPKYQAYEQAKTPEKAKEQTDKQA